MSEDLGSKFGDKRLNQTARHLSGAVVDVFRVREEEANTLNIKCQVCQVTVYGLKNLNNHINGKKHQAKFNSTVKVVTLFSVLVLIVNCEQEWKVVEDHQETGNTTEEMLLSLPAPVSAVTSPAKAAVTSTVTSNVTSTVTSHVDPDKLFPCDGGGAVARCMEGVREPVIGLEYLLEVREEGYRTNPKVLCLLCSKEVMATNIVAHVLSATHRLKYLESFFPIARRKFSKVPNLGVWQKSTFNHLESVIARIETKLGRLKPWIVGGTHTLNIEMEGIRATVEAGQHFKEAVGLNFRTIPDPFESYIEHLPSKEIVDLPRHSQDKDPKCKPGIDLSVPYTPAPLRNSTKVGETSQSDLEKSNVMNRIANLRKEISKDEQRLESQRKLREEVSVMERDRSRRTPGKEKETETVDILSDDEFTPSGSRDLKLRKPEKRGIRSRNPDGKSSRNERDSKIPERELYMDRVEKDTSRERPKRSPVRRERRRSRSRSRSRSRRRARSVSPFVTAMENWNKFKKAEAAMLTDVSSRRNTAERRPEDHPKYGIEWKHFWEKRYKELQSQGRDPNKHDFKAEWIPYWTKQVSNLFDTEVLDRTNDLMKKYNLSSVAEPKREDFRRGRTRSSRSRERRSRSRSRGRQNTVRRSRSRSAKRGRRKSGSTERKAVRADVRNEVTREPRDNFNPFGGPRNDMRDSRQHGRSQDNFTAGNWSQQEEPLQSLDSLHKFGPSETDRQSRGRSLFPLEAGAADMYSGITELEDRRDRGRSETPASRRPANTEELVPCLRLLTALEETLGSLGPLVNQVLARALSMDQSREGGSKMLLEDPDTVSLLDMVKEKLSGLLGAGLVAGSREGAVRVSLDHLTRLLQVATKKRSANLSSYLSCQPATSRDQDGEKSQTLLASTLASSLVLAGHQDISDAELLVIVEELLRVTAEEDPHSALGSYAKSLVEAAASERKMARTAESQFNSYDIVRADRRPERNVPLVTIDDHETSGSLNNLSMNEVRSLLANFNSLSRQEQEDLVNYMKKLEKTNPEKVRSLKEGLRSPAWEEAGRRPDWSPPVSKRARRLSGSDLEINPVNPRSDWDGQPERQGAHQVFTQRNFEALDSSERSQSGAFEHLNPFQRSTRPGGSFGGRGQMFVSRDGEGSEGEGIPLNPLYRRHNYQQW